MPCVGIGCLMGQVWNPKPMPVIQLFHDWDPQPKTIGRRPVRVFTAIQACGRAIGSDIMASSWDTHSSNNGCVAQSIVRWLAWATSMPDREKLSTSNVVPLCASPTSSQCQQTLLADAWPEPRDAGRDSTRPTQARVCMHSTWTGCACARAAIGSTGQGRVSKPTMNKKLLQYWVDWVFELGFVSSSLGCYT